MEAAEAKAAVAEAVATAREEVAAWAAMGALEGLAVEH
jgi:hypothetical protein